MATGPLDLTGIFRAPGVAGIVFADYPAWVWDVEEGRILFANAAGVAFFCEARLSSLQRRRFDMGRLGMMPLGRAKTALPRDGSPKVAMLRFFVGLRDVAVPCTCRLLGAQHSALVLVTAPGGAPYRGAVGEQAALLFEDLDEEIVLLREGEAIYRNAAARMGEATVVLNLDGGDGGLRLVPRDELQKPADGSPDEGSGAAAEPADALPLDAERESSGSGDDHRRFSFVIDADGRFVEVGPALAEAVGLGSADLVGRHWAEVAQQLELDPEGKVATALARQEAWSGIALRWPTDAGASAIVRLSAQPRQGQDASFAGYRGFGEVEPTPVETDGDRSDFSEAAPDEAVEGAPPPTADGLSDQERTAFHTIAKVLTERLPERQTAASSTGSERLEEPPPAVREQPSTPKALGAAELVSAILDRLPDGIAVQRDERILYANESFLNIFGYSDIDDLEIAGGLAALFDCAGDDEARAGSAVVGRRQDGTSVTVESRLGRLDWIDGPAMFVTAREIAVPQISNSSSELDELRAILDTATDGVLVLSAEGEVLSVNRSAEALFGRDAHELLGRSVNELVAEESRASVHGYLGRLASGGVRSVLNDGCEIVGRASGGAVTMFLTMGRLGDDEPARFCAVIRDLTEWKASEAELVAARKRAEEASAQKSDFLAKMSHEMRTPLNAIIGFAEVMLEQRFGAIGNERYLEYVKDIRASGEHIMSLVNDLLDLAKVEAGRLELNFAGVNLNDIVEQSVAIMQPQASRAQVIVRTSLAHGLPSVVADARSIRQVVLNVLSNAIKFTQPGGQAFVSTVRSDNGEVRLRVRDTGIGMSEADIQTALEPFRQLPVRANAQQRGTGLGLPLTRALVEANRAGFAIRSRLNEGTLVEISFPRSRILVD